MAPSLGHTPGAEHRIAPDRVFPGSLRGPGLKTTQGAAAMVWQSSWIHPYEGPMWHCWWDALILRILGSSTSTSVQPQSKFRRGEIIIVAAAEPGMGSAARCSPPSHGRMRSGKELRDVHSLGKTVGERRLREQGIRTLRTRSTPKRQGC